MSKVHQCPQNSKFAKDPNYICNPTTGAWIKIDGPTYKKLIKQGVLSSAGSIPSPAGITKIPLKHKPPTELNIVIQPSTLISVDEDTEPETYCDKLGTLINEASTSCYLDSTLLSLLHKNNDYINDNLLNIDLDTLILTRKYDIKGKMGKCGVPILLSDLPELYKQVQLIQNDLISIKNDLIKGTHSQCTLLRKHLQDYIVIYNRSNLGSTLSQFNWLTAQQEPRDLWVRLNEIFNMPDAAIISKVTYATNVKGICKGPSLIKISERRAKMSVSINIDVGELIELDNNLIKAKINQIDLLSFVNRSKCTHFEEEKNYFVVGSKKYKTHVEEIEYLRSPMLYIHVDRLGSLYGLGKIATPILPSPQIIMKNNDKPLDLVGIIVHRGGVSGGHYMAYLNCAGIWYFYDDLASGSLIKVGDYNKFIESESTKKSLSGVSILTDSTDYFYL